MNNKYDDRVGKKVGNNIVFYTKFKKSMQSKEIINKIKNTK